MANLDYGQKYTDEELKRLERRLKREYRLTSKEVEKILAEYLEQFEEQDDKKAEELKQGKITEREYKNWRIGLIAVGLGWNKVRNRIAKKFTDTNIIASSVISENNLQTYAFNYNFNTFVAETVTKVDTSYALINKEAVEYLRKHEPELLPLKTTMKIDKDLRWNKKQLNAHMIEGLSRGESIPDIAKRLPKAVGEENLNGAIRRARTMTTFAENKARLESAKRLRDEFGIDMTKQWLATLDGRTRHTHRQLDGEVVGLDETFSNGLEEPGDTSGDPAEVYNCRCKMKTPIRGFEKRADDLSTRNTSKLEEEYNKWRNGKPNYYQERKKRKNG